MTDRDLVISTAIRLVAIPSEPTPGDTRAVAEEAGRILAAIPGVTVTRHLRREPVHKIVAALAGARPRRRIALSGHLDTDPAGKASRLTTLPYAPTVRGGRLFGRGAADMKGEIASAIAAIDTLAARRDREGEVSLALADFAEPLPGRRPVRNIRVGGSDARLFRLAGIPTAVFGPTPHGMGGADESVDLGVLFAIADALAHAIRRLLVA